MKAKIAVVDDEKGLVKLVKKFFEMRGYGVVAAYNGKDGLNVIRKERPDIIILDIVMPDMDGSSVLTELKKDNDLKDIPVIVLTARHEQPDRDSLLKLGAHEFITKPFKAHILNRQVEMVLNKKRENLL